MANETTEIIKIVLDADEAIKKTADLKKQRDTLKQTNKELAQSEGDNSVAIAKNEAVIKALDTAIARNNKQTQLLIQQNIAAKGSYEQLLRTQQLAEIELKNLEGTLRTNADGTVVFTQEYYNARKAVDDAKQGILLFNAGISQGSQNVGNYGNTLEGLRARLAELQQNIQTLDIGSQQFKDAQDEAGKLSLQIGQVEGKLDSFGNREPKNPAKEAFQDTLATAGALTGAINLVNLAFDEGSTASEILAKSTQALAIAQNAALIISQKDAIVKTAQAAGALALGAAQSVLNGATAIGTGLMQVFGVVSTAAWAAATLGITALIAGIIALIAYFDDIVNGITDFLGLTSEAEREQKKLAVQTAKVAEELQKQAEAAEAAGENNIKAIDRQIKKQKALGQSTVDLEKKKQREIIKTAEIQLAAARAEIKYLNTIGNLTDEQIKKYNAAGKAIDAQKNIIKDAQNEIDVIDINAKNDEEDRRKKAQEKADAAAEKAREKRKAAQEKAAQETKAYLDNLDKLNEKFVLTDRERLIKSFTDQLNTIKGNSEREIKIREAINKELDAAKEKFDEDTKIKQIERDKKIGLERLALAELNEQDRIQKEFEIIQKGINDRLALLDSANEAEKNEIEDLNLELEKLERDRQNKLTNLRIKEINDRTALNDILQQNELDAVDLSVAFEQEKAVKKAEINLKYLQQQLSNAQLLAQVDNEVTAQELANIEKIKNAIAKAQVDIVKAQQANVPRTIGESIGATPQDAAEIDATIQQVQDSFGSLISVISQNYQQQQKDIEDTKNAEIDAVNESALSQEEKQQKIDEINKKAAFEKYQVDLKQFNAEKALQLVTATINIANAVLKAYAQLGPLGGSVGAAIVGAIGAAQLATIAATKPPAPPKFATGVVGLSGLGNSTSDSIPAMLSNGESVITASGTRYAESNFPGLLQFLNTKNKFADGVVNFNQSQPNLNQINIGQQIRAAIQDLTIVTKVSDIEKASFDRQSVRNVGVI